MLSPEIKELIRDAVALHEKTKWDNEESRRWDVIDDTDTWVDIARAALALNEENERQRAALLEIKRIIGFKSSVNDLTAKLTRILGSLPLADDAPSAATPVNESQPVPFTETK